jgi:hypothetical protein
MDVAESKRCCLWVVRVCIFPGAQQEEKAKRYHMGNGMLADIWGRVAMLDKVLDYVKGDGFNSGRWWVAFRVGLELAMQA